MIWTTSIDCDGGLGGRGGGVVVPLDDVVVDLFGMGRPTRLLPLSPATMRLLHDEDMANSSSNGHGGTSSGSTATTAGRVPPHSLRPIYSDTISLVPLEGEEITVVVVLGLDHSCFHHMAISENGTMASFHAGSEVVVIKLVVVLPGQWDLKLLSTAEESLIMLKDACLRRLKALGREVVNGECGSPSNDDGGGGKCSSSSSSSTNGDTTIATEMVVED